LNGSLVSFDQIDISKLQLCNLLTNNFQQVSPFSATDFSQTCSISVNSLLNFGSNPLFYDFYIMYGNSSTLFPIPVETLNYIDPASNQQVNLIFDTTNHRLQRRLFLVDSVSAKQTATSTPKYVRYASSINIQFTLIDGQTKGNIYPPRISINYAYISTSDLTQSVTVNFQITYSMSLDSQIQAIWISVGVIGFLAFVRSIFRTWIWSRRSGKLAVDIITLFKFLMFLISGLSNVFFIVAIGLAIYWLIFYKGQSLAFVFIPLPSQEASFKSVLIIAFIFKLIDVVHLILVQCSYDIFFIDWERPKLKGASQETTVLKPRNNSDKKKEESKLISDELESLNNVSCWRSLFVGKYII